MKINRRRRGTAKPRNELAEKIKASLQASSFYSLNYFGQVVIRPGVLWKTIRRVCAEYANTAKKGKQ